jgi:6-phosphogluconolactonase
MVVRGYLGRFGSDIGILQGEPGALTVRPGPPAAQPSYLALSLDGRTIYAAEIGNSAPSGDEPPAGQVSAYAVEDDSGLRRLGGQPTGGRGACHLSVDPTGQHVLTANYSTGEITVYPITADGSLGEATDLILHTGSGPNADRQGAPHAHMIVPDPSGEYVLAVDLGTNTVYRYRLSSGRLVAAGEVRVPAGAGPRHLDFHPSGQYAYVANELDSTVSVIDLESFELGTTVSTLAAGDDSVSHPSAIRVSGDGRFCYIANRGPDTIAVLAASPDGAELRLVTAVPCGGKHPRDFVLEGGHLYVANQHSDVVTTFRVDAATGIPEPAGATISTPAPSCLLLLQESSGSESA